MMVLWIDLKLNQYVSIQNTTDSGVGSHKSVLYSISTERVILVLENATLTAIINYLASLLIHFIPDRVDIESFIIKIHSENPLIKAHRKIISCYQSFVNVTVQNPYKSIPKMALLSLISRCCHNFSKNIMSVFPPWK